MVVGNYIFICDDIAKNAANFQKLQNFAKSIWKGGLFCVKMVLFKTKVEFWYVSILQLAVFLAKKTVNVLTMSRL